MSAISVRIFSPNFELLGEIDNYASLLFTRIWHKVGEFELEINLGKRNADKLTKDNIIMLGSDPERTGIITGREITSSVEGVLLKVTGVPLSGLLSRRITYPIEGEIGDEFTATPVETIMRELVDRHAISPALEQRQIPNLVQSQDQGRGEAMDFVSRLKPLDEELEALALYTSLGWDVILDTRQRQFVFRVLEGVDRSFANGVNSPAVFDPARENLISQEFIDTYHNYRNLGVVGGPGEGIGRTIAEAWSGEEESIGLDRFETFLDARDMEGDLDLAARGRQRLTETPGELSFQGEIASRSNLQLGRDYNLGDVVTIQNLDWGVRLDTRITEITEAWTRDGYKISCQFGSSTPTLDAVIRNQYKNVSQEVTR